jgi:hypothetical protein
MASKNAVSRSISIEPVALGLAAGQSHPCGERFRERLKRIDPAVVSLALRTPVSRAVFTEWLL